jgi:hypothetical protein
MKFVLKSVLSTFLVFSITAQTYASTINYPAIVGVKNNENRVIFSKCLKENNCNVLGNQSGYAVDDLEFYSGIRKARAIGTGAAGAVVFAFTALYGYLAFVAVAAPLTTGGITATGVAVTTGSIGASTSFAVIDEINPVYQYKMAIIEDVFKKEHFQDTDFVSLSFKNENEFNKGIKQLKEVLRSIDY